MNPTPRTGSRQALRTSAPLDFASGSGGVEDIHVLNQGRTSAEHAALAARLATGETLGDKEILVSQIGQPVKVMKLKPYFTDPCLKGLYTPDPRHA